MLKGSMPATQIAKNTSFAAVKIDCFDCHADRPEVAVRQSLQQSAKDIESQHDINMNTDELILRSRQLLTLGEIRSE